MDLLPLWLRQGVIAGCMLLMTELCAFGNPPKIGHVPDQVYSFSVQNYNPELGDTWAMNRICWDLMRDHPELNLQSVAGIRIENGKGNSGKVLSFAGETAPDVLLTHWWAIQTDIRNNFLCPLNEFVGYDGFYGLDPETDQPTERTGTVKTITDPVTGEQKRDMNGIIDDDEALWPTWRTYSRMSRLVSGQLGSLDQGPDGKPYEGMVVYGIPQALPTFYGIAYRRDVFRKAGISDQNLPATWEEFWKVCQKLTNPGVEVPGAKFQMGQRAFLLPTPAWQWILWMYSAGGECIRQTKVNPQTGVAHEFPMEETEFTDPDTGESLGTVPSTWKAVFAQKGGVAAMRYYQKLVWAPWIIDSEGTTIDLTDSDIEQGWVLNPATGNKVSFSPDDVINGVVRHSGEGSDDAYEMFRRGEVAMLMAGVDRLENMKIPANNLGFMPVPAGPGGEQLVGYYRHFHSLNAMLGGEKNAERRQHAWTVLRTITGPKAQRDFIDNKVLQGYARFLTPGLLKIAGREEYMDQILPYWRENYDRITKNSRTEPFMGNWAPAAAQIERKVISFLTLHQDFDVEEALIDVEREANSRVMFGLPKEVMDRYRPWMRILVSLSFLLFLGGLVQVVRTQLKDPPVAQTRGVFAWWAPPLMLAPALVSVLIWSYYPLIRGSLMAFQDYRIGGDSTWVGLDNFITVFCTKDFWIYLTKTIKYSVIALSMGFVTPIVTAVLLNEVPRWKTFWRTLYFLPQISSALVIMLIWKLLYNPTEYGLLNRGLIALNSLPLPVIILFKAFLLLVVVSLIWLTRKVILILCDRNNDTGSKARKVIWILGAGVLIDALVRGWGLETARWLISPFGFEAQNWLGDARWAMIAVILPGVWAQAGIGSLIYLAALKSVDDESYEAAEIDGCGFFEKLIHITLPYLKPLIIINFIGAFIATFQSMGNIFAMTGGGPGDETTVLSLAIWYEAFAFMNFGTATAMAWFLGLMLIGFTVYQLKILKKVDFRQASSD